MPHFRLRKHNALGNQENWECDQATIEGALADFGRQLGVVLALKGDVFQYIMQSRSYDALDFQDSEDVPIYVVSAKSN